MADHDAHDHTGVPGAGTPTEILDIPTAETDDTLVLAPDGAGGVEFRAEAAGASAVGFLPWLYPVGLYGLVAFSTNDDLPANGGSLLVPFFLPGPMKLHGVSVRNEDGGSARSWEFRLYLDTNAGVTLDEVANANGSDSFTGAGTAVRTAACATPPTLDPGLYWCVVRNTHASNTFRISYALAGSNMDLVNAKSKTLGSALGSTLDCNTSWSTTENQPGVVLRGRVMGQSVAWV